jgi:hypothetical protein
MEIILVSEAYPRENRRNSNINSSDPVAVAEAIYYTVDKPIEEKLNEVYERFGGLEAFTAKNLSSDMKYLRNLLMRCKNFSPSAYKEIFDKTLKIGRDDAISYAAQLYFLTDLDKFMRVWKASRTDALKAIRDFHRWEHGQYLSERLPMVHAENCRGDEPGNLIAHYSCERPLVYHPHRNLAFHLKAKKEFEVIAAAEVIDFIQENILDCSGVQKEIYAETLIVRSDHWEKLAQDPKRSILNALVENALLPTHVAEEIVTSHKTPYLRESIAKRSVDRDLLEAIWRGTKSESIRATVESNTLFRRF